MVWAHAHAAAGRPIARFLTANSAGVLPVVHFPERGVPVRPRLGAPLQFNHVKLQRSFEIHVHGQVLLQADVSLTSFKGALKPLWKYAGARSLADGAASAYEEEPGIKYDAQEHLLQMCWTVRGDEEDFRQSLDEMCMSLNELAEQGAAIEVTFYDTDFMRRRKEEQGRVQCFLSRDRRVQRDLLVPGRGEHDGAELGSVVAEIDKLFSQRFDALVNSLEIGNPCVALAVVRRWSRRWWWPSPAPSALICASKLTACAAVGSDQGIPHSDLPGSG